MPPFLDSTKFLCSRVLNRELQLLIENSVWDFNLHSRCGYVTCDTNLLNQPLYRDTMPLMCGGERERERESESESESYQTHHGGCILIEAH